jgi:arginine decarboxylase
MQDEPVQERQIDQFFPGPGARADEWRELVEAAKTWSVGSGDRNKFLAQLALIAVTKESTPALNPEGKIP